MSEQAPFNILWLEEDDGIASLVRVSAKKWFPGANVFVAETPAQAEEFLSRNVPNIVFGEIWEGSGIHKGFRELMLRVRERHPECRLAIVSTHENLAHHVPGAEHMRKPFNPAKFRKFYHESMRG